VQQDERGRLRQITRGRDGRRHPVGVGHERGRVELGELSGQLGHRTGRVERRHHARNPRRGDRCGGEGGFDREQESDALAGAHVRSHGQRELSRPAVQIGEGQPGRARDDGGHVGRPPALIVEDVAESLHAVPARRAQEPCPGERRCVERHPAWQGEDDDGNGDEK